MYTSIVYARQKIFPDSLWVRTIVHLLPRNTLLNTHIPYTRKKPSLMGNKPNYNSHNLSKLTSQSVSQSVSEAFNYNYS